MTESACDRVDTYLACQPDGARVQCEQLRAAILGAGLGLQETWKWNGPCYERAGLVCGFDAGKHFVAITFFRGSELADSEHAFNHCVDNQHNRSIRFAPGERIPAELIAAYAREAVTLNLAGPRPVLRASPVDELTMPADLLALLQQFPEAKATFDSFAPYKRRDYVDWISEAKRAATRQQRLDRALANLKAGVALHDKYRS